MKKVRRALVAAIALPIVVSCAGILGIDGATLENEKGPAGDGGGGTGEDASQPKGLCAEYCATALKNCSGDFELYPTLKFCLAVCATLPEGQRTDLVGNSVGCRLHFAESAAAIEKQFNCSAAGPGGNGICGDNCESFCIIDANICPEIYASTADCMDACAMFPPKGSYTDLLENQIGNSLECRLYHVNAAAGIDRNVHCPHTDIDNTATPCK